MKPLRVLVAPSGFKESLDAEEVAEAIAEGVRRACPAVVIDELPLVDGGEGTSRTLARVTGGEVRDLTVCGPIGEPVEACFAMLGDSDEPTAAVDLASAAGLRMVPRDRRDPSRTTTRGVGELMLAALDAGARRILVGCGDSGVNDGGAGLAQALGVRLLDAQDRDLPAGGVALADLARIDLSGLDPRIAETRIEVACNIKNVLTGENGVARVFGPQKGASPEDVERLAAALDTYAEVIERDLGIDVREMPGGGASGGVGAGLHALLGAELRSRFDVLLPRFDLDGRLAEADLVLTAEGGLDFKTARGKIPAEVGEHAAARGVPVIMFAGTIGENPDAVKAHGVDAWFSILTAPETLEEAMSHSREALVLEAEQVMRAVLIGMRMAEGRAAVDD